MALLTDEQLHAIREIVRKHHQAFVVNTVGVSAVPPEVLEELQRAGLVEPEITSIEDAYKFGQALAAGTNPDVANMSLEQFKRWLRTNPIPLTSVERRAIEIAQHRAGQYAVGLGNRIDTEIGERIVQADRALAQRMRDEIKTATAANIARRQSIKGLVSDLKWSTKDWSRDWDRIAITEKHTAMQQGVADNYAKEHGPDVLVAKRPLPGACKHCVRLHLGADGQPYIFKLSQLEANGSNYGRKAADWEPVVGSLHPNCSCQMVRIPVGWGFDENGSLVPGGELGTRIASNQQLKRALEAHDDLRKAVLAGHVTYQGIPIAIETAKGQKRKWTDAQGNQGETLMLYDYGYVKKTEGDDAEEVDVYLGGHPDAGTAFLVNQLDPATGMHDEQKLFLGFLSAAAVRVAFQAHRNDEGAFGDMTSMDIEQLKRWLSGTAPKAGHNLNRERHVIPLPSQHEMMKTRETFVLRKAVTRRTGPDLVSGGNISTEMGAQSSPAAYRNPGHGTFPNFLDGSVQRKPVRMHPALEGWDPNEHNPLEVEQKRVHAEPDDYTLTIGGAARQPLKVFPILHEVTDALYVRDAAAEKKEAGERKLWLERMEEANRQRPRNNVDVDQE